jgi:type VI secretion system protein ImpK
MRGKSRGFAPHAERPDQIAHKLGSDLSLWALAMVFSVVTLGGYLGFRTALAHETTVAMAGYNDLVKLPPRSANVTITLP